MRTRASIRREYIESILPYDRLNFTIDGLSHEEELILNSLPNPTSISEQLFRRDLADKLYNTLKEGSEEHAADAWDAHESYVRARNLDDELADPRLHSYRVPTRVTTLSRIRSFARVKDATETVRQQVGNINRLATAHQSPFHPNVGVVLGHAGTVSNSMDFLLDLIPSLYKTFRHKRDGESKFVIQRLGNHLSKGARPFRLLNSTLSVTSSIIGLTAKTIATSFAFGTGSSVLFFGLTCIEAWREVERYNSLLRKLKNKRSKLETSYGELRFERNELRLEINRIRERSSILSISAQETIRLHEDRIDSIEKEMKAHRYQIRGLDNIIEKTEVKRATVAADNRWKIGRALVLSTAITLFSLFAPQVAIVLAWGILIIGAVMAIQKAMSLVKEQRQQTEKENEIAALAGANPDPESPASRGLPLSPTPAPSSPSHQPSQGASMGPALSENPLTDAPHGGQSVAPLGQSVVPPGQSGSLSFFGLGAALQQQYREDKGSDDYNRALGLSSAS